MASPFHYQIGHSLNITTTYIDHPMQKQQKASCITVLPGRRKQSLNTHCYAVYTTRSPHYHKPPGLETGQNNEIIVEGAPTIYQAKIGEKYIPQLTQSSLG